VLLHVSADALKPQRGVHYEAGIRSAPARRLSAEAGLYYVRSRDEIGFDLANFRYANIDRSAHAGGEGRITCTPVRWLEGEVEYTYTRARFVGGENDGKQINNVPEEIAHGRVTLFGPRGGSLSAGVTDVRRQWLDEADRYPIPAYTVFDLNLVMPAGPLQLVASVDNLFDRIYAPSAYLTTDEMGRDLPLYFPAAGRSYRIGLRRNPV